jgi:Predicted UDP-glucose 6-dehydrogenase
MMDITVFGMGYVGCVTAGCLADMGHSVTGVDLQETKVSLINAGKSPVIEPALGDVIQRGVATGRLHATQRVQKLGDVSLVCVGTPGNENGSLDLAQVQRVVGEIGDLLREETVFTSWSSGVPFCPGRWTMWCGPCWNKGLAKKEGKDFGICMNPEFMRKAPRSMIFIVLRLRSSGHATIALLNESPTFMRA